MWRFGISVFVGALALAGFFRAQLASGFNLVLSEFSDGFIQLSIMQHWANVFSGREWWDTTSYFFPWPDTLGYNDGYLLFGIPYALARKLSLDPFLAETAAFFAMKAVGFVGFVLFALDVAGLGLWTSLLGAMVVTIASNSYLQAAHGQLLATSLAPMFGWLLWRAGCAVASRRSPAALAWGWTAAVLFGAWLLTGFYTAWFTVLLFMLFGVASLPFVRVRALIRWPILAIAAGFVVAAIPFAVVYLPKARETGMHGFGETFLYLPSLLDYLHIGRDNVVFGWLDGWLTDALRPGFPEYGEHTIGFAPALLVTAFLGAVLAWRERSRSFLPIGMALATFAALALAVHVGKHTLWSFVYLWVPGARAVRVVSRFALVLTFPLTVLAMLWLDRLRRPWLAVGFAALLIAEEFTTGYTPLLDRPAALTFLSSIPPSPAQCRVFYVTGITPSHTTGSSSMDMVYPHNTDAMLIASLRHIPTINGISTFNPPDWELTSSSSAAYVRTVRTYLAQHGLEQGVCGLDLGTRLWSKGWPAPPTAEPLALGTTYPFGSAALDPILYKGWEGSGPVGRWTIATRALMYFAVPHRQPGQDLRVDFEGLPLVWNDGHTSPLTLFVNGQAVTTWHPIAGRQHLSATIPAALLDTPQIEMAVQVEQPLSPSELGMSSDSRRLGFFVVSFRLDREGD